MTTTIRRLASLTALMTALPAIIAPSALALGFRNPDQGARATAQGEAFIVQADDASAVYYNPAGLTQLEGTHLASGGMLILRDIRFSGPAGRSTMNDPAFTPHFYAATDAGLEQWRFGLGVNVPFGNAVDWGRNGLFQRIVTETRLTVVNIAPTVAFQLNDHLSLGASLNVYHGDTSLKNRPFAPFFPATRFKFDGDGQAVGATAGLLWKINEQHAVGAVYRSPFRINFDGRASLANPPPFPPVMPGPSSASASIQFPQSVAVGYAWRPTERLKLEVNVDWTNWDTLNTVNLRSSNPTFDASTNPDGASIPFHWKDSFFYEFGAQYRLNEHCAVRAGYIFSENSVPDSTYSPVMPDADRHVFSVGFGYDSVEPLLFKRGVLLVDIAYQYAVSETRNVSGSIHPEVNGKWRSDSHSVILTGTIKF
jgi:long-chain fatty acid transport protein